MPSEKVELSHDKALPGAVQEAIRVQMVRLAEIPDRTSPDDFPEGYVLTREEIVDAFHAIIEADRAARPSLAAQDDCLTCHGDPAVCASIPGLRHCEKAMREPLFSAPLPPTAPSATVTPEQFRDVLKRIVSRMSGHTINSCDIDAWNNFMALLELTTPYSCGIGPMPREGNCAASDESSKGKP